MKKKIFLFAVVAFFVLALVAVVVADVRFGAVRPSPRVEASSLIKPETRAVIVLNPSLAQKVIYQQVANLNPKIPTWAVDATLPYQAAIVFDVDYAMSKMNGTIFVNDQRLGPVIRDQFNKLEIPEPFTKVLEAKMEQKERGVLTRAALWNLDRDAMSKLRWQWKDIKVDKALLPEGNHLLEAVVDNRDGGGLVVLSTVYGMLFGTGVDSFMTSSAQDIAMAYSSIRIAADLNDNNELKIHAEIACSPVADEGIKGYIPKYYELMKKTLQSELGRFESTVTCEMKDPVNDVYAVDFTLTNASELIAGNAIGAFLQM